MTPYNVFKEQVAAALFEKDYGEPWDEATETARWHWLEMAETAITAMDRSDATNVLHTLATCGVWTMTDIEKKALALLNECGWGGKALNRTWNPCYEALCRAIEQHEAFRQEVSDALREWGVVEDGMQLSRFIIAKPDPLLEAVGEAMEAHEIYSKFELTDSLREALAKRGGKIVWEND